MEFKKILFVVTSHDKMPENQTPATDGKLITGQNPASSVLAAQTVTDLFERMR